MIKYVIKYFLKEQVLAGNKSTERTVEVYSEELALSIFEDFRRYAKEGVLSSYLLHLQQQEAGVISQNAVVKMERVETHIVGKLNYPVVNGKDFNKVGKIPPVKQADS